MADEPLCIEDLAEVDATGGLHYVIQIATNDGHGAERVYQIAEGVVFGPAGIHTIMTEALREAATELANPEDEDAE